MRIYESKHRSIVSWHHRQQRTGFGPGGGPLTALEVREVDGTPDVNNVTIIRVSNGSLTDNGGGDVTIVTGGGGSLTVKEVDGTPSVSPVTTIRVSNGTLTDDGSGQVTINTTGGITLGNSSSYQAFDIQSPPSTPTSQDDEFNGGPALDGKWTQVNWSGLTANNVNSTKPGALWIDIPSNAGDLLRSILQAIPAGDFTIITAITPSFRNLDFWSLGLIVTDGTTAGAGNQIIFIYNNATASTAAVAHQFTNFNTFSSQLSFDAINVIFTGPLLLRLRRSGTTYTASWSIDGRTWRQFFSTTISFTATHFGLVANNNATGTGMEDSFDFFRYSASATTQFGNLTTYGGGLIVSPKAATPYTVLNADLNTVFTNEGATAQIVFNLPTAVANLTYTFFVQDADGVKVVANTGDTIRLAGSVSAAAGNIVNNTIGGSVTLVAINATEWVATSIVGTWTVT